MLKDYSESMVQASAKMNEATRHLIKKDLVLAKESMMDCIVHCREIVAWINNEETRHAEQP